VHLAGDLGDPIWRFAAHTMVDHGRKDVHVGPEGGIVLADDLQDRATVIVLPPGDAEQAKQRTRARALDDLARAGDPRCDLLVAPGRPGSSMPRQDQPGDGRHAPGGEIDPGVGGKARERAGVKRRVLDPGGEHLPVAGPANEIEPHPVDLVLCDQFFKGPPLSVADLGHAGVHPTVSLVRLDGQARVGDGAAAGHLGPPALADKAAELGIDAHASGVRRVEECRVSVASKNRRAAPVAQERDLIDGGLVGERGEACSKAVQRQVHL